MSRLFPSSVLLCSMAALLGACTSTGTTPGALAARTALVERTTHGVAHITAPDMETLAYGAAYAHAQDNVCQTAQQLLTVRGERSKFLGSSARGLLGLRALPNEQIDFFIAAHMDDAALQRAWARSSADAQAMLRGYVAGFNRYLADHAKKLPASCAGQAWVQPMTEADMRRLSELSSVQAGIAALADGMLGAQPPAAKAAQAESLPPLALAAAEMRERGLLDSPYGSNAWAFGKDSSANGRGLLLGNPHFPWVGVNRFWQMHLTIPGQLDVMGAAIGHGAVVQIGFNKDVAWSHTVSTGKRFTLHELSLVDGQSTQYLLDGKPEAMRPRTLNIQVKQTDGSLATKTHTMWDTRWGPVVVVPNARLGWTAQTAYALQDANSGNARSVDTWLALNRAASVADMRQGLANLGTPWVNTIAADRHGQALYADASVVPDVDAAHLQRCAPSAGAAALFKAAGLVVLNGSRSDCDWRRDSASAVPGLTPISRLPVAVRTDWVHNSNDSFFYSHPAQKFEGISPLVGDAGLNRPRTRAGLTEIPQMLARGKASPASVQQQLFANHNFMGAQVVPDLLAACRATPPTSADAREGCAALKGWNLSSNGDARGAHLFREFWRTARTIPQVYRIPFDATQPVTTPTGLKMADEAVANKVWDALAGAAKKVKDAGFALDAPLASVQRPAITEQAIGLHGGDEIEGVLNNLGDRAAPGIGPKGLRIDYGTSYVQTVTFDERRPLAQAILTYGQSSEPGSTHATDQLQRYAAKQWPVLPFHRADIEQARIAPPLTLARP